jgi:hypothetical protein
MVEQDIAAFELLPCAVGTTGGDGVVDPAQWNAARLLVVEDGLEGGDDLFAMLGSAMFQRWEAVWR